MTPDVQNLIALPPGYRLGEYRIERYLGSGGFGITYSAIDEHLDHRVAIKEFLPSSLAVRNTNDRVTVATVEDEPDFQWGLERFLDEARSLARFDHPNIVSVKRFLEAHGTGYIVMEYVDGEPLSEMLRRKPTLTEAEIREHVLPLTGGLAKVHADGLLHRDIKPSNIVVRANGVPVLIDFGSARRAVSAKSRSLTAVITPGYAPLEQYSSSMGDQRATTDIYALGAVLYRCVTGKTPWDATERALEDRLTPVAEAADGVYSVGLLTAIDAALAMRADERPRDIAAFLQLASAGDNERAIADALDATMNAYDRGEYEFALREFGRLAELGLADAQYYLGLIYKHGRGVPDDDAQAVQWFARAARQGHAYAQKRLAVSYITGAGVLEDHAQAVQWATRAAEQGLADVQYFLGNMYANGEGVPQDRAQAIQWCTRASEQGHAQAQYKLGCIYANGEQIIKHVLESEGMPEDHAQAVQWFTRAAEQGHAGAQDQLGIMYEIGMGVPENHAQAVQWYTRAAEQGHVQAQYHLADMYYNGMGVRADNVQAYAWANLASTATSKLTAGFAATLRDKIAANFSEPQLSESQQLSRVLDARIWGTVERGQKKLNYLIEAKPKQDAFLT